MNQLLDTLKQNKKILIILGAVVAVFLILLVIASSGKNNNSYFSTLNSLNNETQYNGTINVNVGGKTLNINIAKSGDNYAITMSDPDSEHSYGDILVKQNGTTYLNMGSYKTNGGLIALRDVKTEENPVKVTTTVISALSNAMASTVDAENGAMITIDSTENWKIFWSAIQTALAENSEAIISGVKEQTAAEALLNVFINAAKKAAETETVANTIKSSLKAETIDEVRNYTGTFEITADFDTLPDFITADDFDSNQLKITGEISITSGESSTAKPSGAVYDANPESVISFIKDLWSDLFSKEKYVPLNEVTVAGTTVTNKYDLGETIEESQFEFDKNGITSAKWIISSTSESIIKAYEEKYKQANPTLTGDAQSYFKLVLIASQEGLETLNKLGSTPEAFSEYLKTAKGGNIIV